MNALSILSTGKTQEVICTLVRKELCTEHNYGFNGFVKINRKKAVYSSGLGGMSGANQSRHCRMYYGLCRGEP
jgi:hypothetical protein